MVSHKSLSTKSPVHKSLSNIETAKLQGIGNIPFSNEIKCNVYKLHACNHSFVKLLTSCTHVSVYMQQIWKFMCAIEPNIAYLHTCMHTYASIHAKHQH